MTDTDLYALHPADVESEETLNAPSEHVYISVSLGRRIMKCYIEYAQKLTRQIKADAGPTWDSARKVNRVAGMVERLLGSVSELYDATATEADPSVYRHLPVSGMQFGRVAAMNVIVMRLGEIGPDDDQRERHWLDNALAHLAF